MKTPESVRQVRARLGTVSFPKDEIDDLAVITIGRLREWFHEHLRDTDLINRNLLVTDEYIKLDEGLPLTPSYVSSIYLEMFGSKEIQDLALRIAENLEEDAAKTAALLFDISRGFLLVTGLVHYVSLGQYPPLGQLYPEGTPKMSAVWRNKWDLPQILRDNPSGDSLMSWMVDRLSEEDSPLLVPYELNPGLVEGAKLARELMGIFQPQAETFIRRITSN